MYAKNLLKEAAAALCVGEEWSDNRVTTQRRAGLVAGEQDSTFARHDGVKAMKARLADDKE